MHKLSGLDAAFVYLELPRAPMHVGGVYVFDAAGRTRRRRFDFHALREQIAARLDSVPTFRQRLVTVPFDLDYPYWVDDPNFDLDAHLTLRKLPHPGGQRELMQLAEELFSRRLDTHRPLWHITLVEGLRTIDGIAPNSFALIVKVHHAAVDGVSGQEMVWALLDQTATSQALYKPADWQPKAPPSQLQLLRQTAEAALPRSLQLTKIAGQFVGGAAATVKERFLRHTPLPPLPFAAPFTPFNTAVSARRIFRAQVFSLDTIRRLRDLAPGSTVNDVVLTICAGATTRYLSRKQTLPKTPLVAMAPISIRSRDEHGERGNQVSAMLVSLATHEDDPRRRLQLISASATHAKVYSELLSPERLTAFTPSLISRLLVQLYCKSKLTQRFRPFFNLFITNVPGPRKPLYLGGAPMAYHFGMAPVFDGLGFIIVITSYLNTLSISATACHAIMPDMDAFMNDLQAALDELVALRDQADAQQPALHAE